MSKDRRYHTHPGLSFSLWIRRQCNICQSHQEILYELFITSLCSLRQRWRKDKLKERMDSIEKFIALPGKAVPKMAQIVPYD
jgi:hypothetical protein